MTALLGSTVLASQVIDLMQQWTGIGTLQHEGMRLEDVRTASHARCVHSCLTKLLHLCLVSPGIRQK